MEVCIPELYTAENEIVPFLGILKNLKMQKCYFQVDKQNQG
jgi:hypothetical protein